MPGKLQLPHFASYGEYSSDNYGVNAMQVSLPGLTLYYSYKTIVAFYTYATGKVVHENDWGPTTGKHLNWIDDGDKKNRVPDAEFQAKLQIALQLTFGGNNE